MLRLMCNILKKSMLIHTWEETYIHVIIVVSVIKNPVHKMFPLLNPFVKMNYFVHKNSYLNDSTNLMYKYSVILFCKLMLIFISEHHLYFS